MPKKTKNNGTLNIHFIVHENTLKEGENLFLKRNFVYKTAGISKYKIRDSKKFVNLLDNLNNLNNETVVDKTPETHLLSQISFSIMYNSIKFNVNQVPSEIISDIAITDKMEYLPVTFVNTLAIRDEHYLVSL